MLVVGGGRSVGGRRAGRLGSVTAAVAETRRVGSVAVIVAVTVAIIVTVTVTLIVAVAVTIIMAVVTVRVRVARASND